MACRYACSASQPVPGSLSSMARTRARIVPVADCTSSHRSWSLHRRTVATACVIDEQRTRRLLTLDMLGRRRANAICATPYRAQGKRFWLGVGPLWSYPGVTATRQGGPTRQQLESSKHAAGNLRGGLVTGASCRHLMVRHPVPSHRASGRHHDELAAEPRRSCHGLRSTHSDTPGD